VIYLLDSGNSYDEYITNILEGPVEPSFDDLQEQFLAFHNFDEALKLEPDCEVCRGEVRYQKPGTEDFYLCYPCDKKRADIARGKQEYWLLVRKWEEKRFGTGGYRNALIQWLCDNHGYRSLSSEDGFDKVKVRY